MKFFSIFSQRRLLYKEHLFMELLLRQVFFIFTIPVNILFKIQMFYRQTKIKLIFVRGGLIIAKTT